MEFFDDENEGIHIINEEDLTDGRADNAYGEDNAYGRDRAYGEDNANGKNNDYVEDINYAGNNNYAKNKTYIRNNNRVKGKAYTRPPLLPSCLYYQTVTLHPPSSPFHTQTAY